jgi:hypothetical protein
VWRNGELHAACRHAIRGALEEKIAEALAARGA